MKYLQILYFVFVIAVGINNSSAQEFTVNVNSFNENAGLSHSNVKAITQDSTGFIWIGTYDGLNRFDGHEFKLYRSNSSNLLCLQSNVINALLTDQNNDLWVATNRGLSLYNRMKDNFTPYLYEDSLTIGQYDIVHITEAGNRHFYLTINFIGILDYNADTKEKKIYAYEKDNNKSINSNRVLSTFIDSRKNLWVTTLDSGICVRPYGQENFIRFKHEEDNPFSLPSNDVHSIAEDAESNIWIGCNYGGLSRIHLDDLSDKKFENYFTYTTQPNGLLSDNIRKITTDSDNNLWIGTKEGMISVFNGRQFQNISIDDCDFDYGGINEVNCFFEDSESNIWVGTDHGGAHLISRSNPGFTTITSDEKSKNNIWEFAEDRSGNIWVATDGAGLKCYYQASRGWINYSTQNTNLKTDKVLSVFIDSDDNIWIGTWAGGFSKFDIDNKSFDTYTVLNSDLSDNNVFDITEDFQGNLWIATYNGINKFNRNTKSFKVFTPDNSDLIHRQTEVIKTDSKGNILIGNIIGFNILDPLTEQFKTYIHDPDNKPSLSDNFITSIFEENDSIIWITTANGLNKFNRNTEIFTSYFIEDGLPSNMVYGIEKDDSSCFWISTYKGLSRFDPIKNSFKNYTHYDGIQSDKFVKKSHLKTRSGLIYFGGISGYNIIDISKLVEKTPRLVFTELIIKNATVNPDDHTGILENNFTYTHRISLKPEYRNFNIKFTAIDFINQMNQRYAYKLEGFEEDWNFIGNQHIISYTNLNPGEYKLLLTTSTGTFLNHENTITLTIEILPAWWETLLFKIAVVCVVMSIIYLLYRLRTIHLRKQKSTLTKEVQKRTLELSDANAELLRKQEQIENAYVQLEESKDEILTQNEELEKHKNHLEKLVAQRTKKLEEALERAEESGRLKSAFLANLSHEIRTPMNAISGFSYLLKEPDSEDEEREGYIDLIISNCETLNVLINDIIDISLIESDQIKIEKNHFYVNPIIVEIIEYCELKRNKSIQIIFDNQYDTDDLVLVSDAVRFRQIVSNLLTNAYKYTDKGTINIGYKKHDNEIRFYVKDTGIGISKEEFENIFNEFHKIENRNTKVYRGVGLGLSICKSLLEKMGGKIWLESKVNVGSTFYFSLPNGFIAKSNTQKNIKAKSVTVHYDFSGLSILIVEDESANSMLMEKMLRKTHVTIHHVGDGKAAVDFVSALQDRSNLIILMDIKLPVMDGIQAFNIIRKKYKDIPIIAVTAYSSENEKADIMKNNFEAYITKPIKRKLLLEAIQANMNKP